MKRYEHSFANFKWIDCEGPSQSDLMELANEFNIPLQPLANCLDPEHLPHGDVFDKTVYFILRHYDVKAKPKAGTMQELTTKLVFFVGADYVLTIHRASLNCIENKKVKADFEMLNKSDLVKNLIVATLASFDPPLDELDAKTDQIEERVFALRRRNILRPGYLIKRKASAYRKIFKFTSDVLTKIQDPLGFSSKDLSAVREPLDKLIYYADDNFEEITGLLSLHLSLMSQKTNEASYRTNEIMRVLTVVSIFFLPLNFITGVYGMNFEHMPELKSEHGYYVILGIMLFVVTMISIWIFRKGWVSKEDI
ncbi:CorA family divalent cation transporter [Bdellovibrio sp. HCB2-146]|uniref:CorA family divalent cation transporter n=1 Tax=Bdellovibrio sp. HCB2-146 TaxID=3394362 RepID=UPI0039BC9523